VGFPFGVLLIFEGLFSGDSGELYDVPSSHFVFLPFLRYFPYLFLTYTIIYIYAGLSIGFLKIFQLFLKKFLYVQLTRKLYHLIRTS
jgi:hypothetical protein